MTFYFDHNASTPVSEEALAAMTAAAREAYGNPSSIHAQGQAARQAVDAARGGVAALLGASPKEIVFTSGGTEADNLALLGVEARHVIVSAIEHPAVLGAASELERRGVAVSLAPVDANGVVDVEALRGLVRPDTGLISVMHANNETGAIQPIAEMAAIAREGGALLHSDGVQAAARMPVDVKALGVDLYSISGHKVGAPKGVGALYVREGVQVRGQLFGGRHERERRAGTENVPGIAALGAAARWLSEHRDEERGRVAALRDRLEQGVLARIPCTRVNSAAAPRAANTANIVFEGLEGESLVIALDLAGFAVSTGAACSSGAVHASHVLLAMGLSKEEARASMRFSLGRTNDEAQVDALLDALEGAVARLRKLSPAYDHAV
ncbi:MAG: cysteine desulfurase [Bryobacteraceae bacterium]|nr:cysteine desulfurase [Bryobacteraceae bacterium]